MSGNSQERTLTNLRQARANWLERLSHYELELSMTASPDVKFELNKKIYECREKIAEKEAQISEILDSVDLISEVGVDYSQLEKLLYQGRWREADEETARVMLKAAKRESEGWLDVENIEQFPCADLRTIDQLWVKYSEGRFGFSVQKRIYVECGATLDGEYPGDEIWEKFCDRIGWRQNGEWMTYNQLTFSTSAPRGHLPLGVVLVLCDGFLYVEGFSSLAQRTVTCSL